MRWLRFDWFKYNWLLINVRRAEGGGEGEGQRHDGWGHRAGEVDFEFGAEGDPEGAQAGAGVVEVPQDIDGQERVRVELHRWQEFRGACHPPDQAVRPPWIQGALYSALEGVSDSCNCNHIILFSIQPFPPPKPQPTPIDCSFLYLARYCHQKCMEGEYVGWIKGGWQSKNNHSLVLRQCSKAETIS